MRARCHKSAVGPTFLKTALRSGQWTWIYAGQQTGLGTPNERRGPLSMDLCPYRSMPDLDPLMPVWGHRMSTARPLSMDVVANLMPPHRHTTLSRRGVPSSSYELLHRAHTHRSIYSCISYGYQKGRPNCKLVAPRAPLALSSRAS